MIPKIFHSRSSLMAMQASLLLLLLAGLAHWLWEPLAEIYWGPLATELGKVVNGAIAALLLLALVRIFYLLYAYMRESRFIGRFVEQLDFGLTEAGIEDFAKSLIVRRYRALQQNMTELERPEQAPLAALLLDQETARLELIRLAQSLIVLLGALGAAASLLLGMAVLSGLLSQLQGSSGIVSISHAAVTALSITMTAIAAYLALTLVLSRLLASQSSVCRQIESLTFRQLVPMVMAGSGDMVDKLARRAQDLGEVAVALADTQERLVAQVEAMASERQAQGEHGDRLLAALREVNETLLRAFRLEPPES